ncbi:hypothetical protein ES703_85799 [subsurface metagenome]
MIIVYPDDIIRFGDSSNYVGESCVGSFVGLPEIFAIFRVEGEMVKERPDGSVADTVVVGFDIMLCDRNWMAVFR